MHKNKKILGGIFFLSLLLVIAVYFMIKTLSFNSSMNDNPLSGQVTKTIEKDQIKNMNDSFSNITEEVHWTHMPIKYRVNFSEYSEEKKAEKIRNLNYALERIHTAVPYISFVETYNNDEDILFLGEIPTNIRIWASEHGVENAGGLTMPLNFSGNYITHSVIYLPEALKNDNSLMHPAPVETETHETLHAFDIGHSNVLDGVMYPYLNGKTTAIENGVISCLDYIYSNGNYNGNCSKANMYQFCGQDSVLGNDNICHTPCGSGYCEKNSSCCNNQCWICPDGSYLGDDCNCHPS